MQDARSWMTGPRIWLEVKRREKTMPAKKLIEFLNGEKVKYVTLNHSPAYTAQEITATTHTPGKEFAKTVIVKLDGEMAMIVVPASHQVDLESVKKASDAKEVALATEEEFQLRFPDCDVGAMPPFGNLYGMDVYVAASLAESEEIVFNPGSHLELIRLAYRDFWRLVRPKALVFSRKGK